MSFELLNSNQSTSNQEDIFSNTDSDYFNEINSISYSAYRLILHRFNNSPGNERIIAKAIQQETQNGNG